MIITVKVKTRSSKREIRKSENENTFEVHTNEPATENRANLDVIKLVAEYFKVSKGQVNIKSGLKSKNKIIIISEN